jgi:hypothetical protein
MCAIEARTAPETGLPLGSTSLDPQLLPDSSDNPDAQPIDRGFPDACECTAADAVLVEPSV